MKVIFFILVFLLLAAAKIIAGDNPISASDISEYSVRIKKVEACNSTDTTTIASCSTNVLFDGDSGFVNIRSVNANQDIQNLVSGIIPSPGTYNRIRTTVGNDYRIKAQFTSGGTTYFTNAATTFGGSIVHTVANTNTTGANAVVTIVEFGPTGANLTLYTNQAVNGIYRNASGDLIHIGTPSSAISASIPTVVDVAFNVNNAILFNDDIAAALYFRPDEPTVTLTVTETP